MKNDLRYLFICFGFIHIALLSSGQGASADCESAKILCDKSPLVLNELPGSGIIQESAPGDCFPSDFQESNAVWFKWKAADNGTLSFTLLPLNETDDLDFVLYQIKGFENCISKSVLRCMAAGPKLGETTGFLQGCTGATGLVSGYTEESQQLGCSKGAANFLSPIELKAGSYYALYIHNYRSSGGILVEWGGSGTFEAIPEQCQSQSTGSTTPILGGNQGEIQFSEPFPSPTTDQVSVSIQCTESYSGHLQVIGADGQVENTQRFEFDPGNSILNLPTEGLRRGVHFIKFISSGSSYVLRFVKG